MPCRTDGYEHCEENTMKRDMDQATRAACDMRTVLRASGLEYRLCLETIEWIKRHDKADAERIEREVAEGKREQVKRDALNKLSMEERRVLGL